MAHDPEDWCKIWRNTDLLFQKWQEFGEFWPEHSKVSKMFTLTGSFWTKYISFELKKYRGVIFLDTEEWCKIWRKTDLENDMTNLANFHQSAWKCQNWDFDGILLSKVENVFELKIYRGIMCHDIEEWCKIWKEIDVSF